MQQRCFKSLSSEERRAMEFSRSAVHLCGWWFCSVLVRLWHQKVRQKNGQLWAWLFPVCFVRLLNFCLRHSVPLLKLWRGETRQGGRGGGGGQGGGIQRCGEQICHCHLPGDDCHHPFHDVNWSIDNKLRGGPNDKDVIAASWKSLDMLRAVVQLTVMPGLSAVYDFLLPLGTDPEIAAMDGRRWSSLCPYIDHRNARGAESVAVPRINQISELSSAWNKKKKEACLN